MRRAAQLGVAGHGAYEFEREREKKAKKKRQSGGKRVKRRLEGKCQMAVLFGVGLSRSEQVSMTKRVLKMFAMVTLTVS